MGDFAPVGWDESYRRTEEERRKQLPEVRVLRLQPGDIIVAKLHDEATLAHAEEIRGQLQEKFPDYEVLMLAGLDLEVARPHSFDGQGGDR